MQRGTEKRHTRCAEIYCQRRVRMLPCRHHLFSSARWGSEKEEL